MIILYSITGIITALFLTIIITGAVRAHRHPERYGPRYAVGRPRQNRAKGIARAMLETLPIVRFGDADHDQQPDVAKGDVEMNMDHDEGVEHSPEPGTTPAPNSPNDVSDEKQAAGSGASTPQPPQPNHPDNFSCPICTDDFVKGQDIRLLPCNHSFHPDCIDPWLVNVSGTCPLWYVLQPSRMNETNK